MGSAGLTLIPQPPLNHRIAEASWTGLGAAMSEDLADRLTRAPRDRTHANVRPRDAATLVIVDRTSRKPKVLMGRRHPGHRFMPGKFVFPGGRVESGDRRMPAYGALDGITEARLL